MPFSYCALRLLPGGQPGSDNLNSDPRIHSLLKKLANSGKFTAAICAAPTVLAHAGLLDGKRATGFPGTLEKLAPTKITVENIPVVREARSSPRAVPAPRWTSPWN